MTSVARRIVSGQKARFKDPILSLDLDLVYVTDNIIIMGFPASGVASLYRNSRSSVRKFLDHRHEDLYRIYNFCPRAENGYDADYFYDRVSRYPFPDHHVPPLSMIPLFVADMTEWLESDPDNVGVIHCKAGKGRSGTMTCCYLLSLPYLPSPPQNLRNYSELRRPPASPPAEAEDEANGRYWEKQRHHQRVPTDGSDYSSPALRSPPSARRDSAAYDDEERVQGDHTHVEELAAKLQAVFALHTSRRMKPPASSSSSSSSAAANPSQASTQTLGRRSVSFVRSSASFANPSQADLSTAPRSNGTNKSKCTLGATPAGRSCDALHLSALDVPASGFGSTASLAPPHAGTMPKLGRSQSSFALNQNTEDHGEARQPKMGVSIPSQRRWVGYWARMLAGLDARISIAHPYSTPPRRKVRITRISIDRGLGSDVKTAAGLVNRVVPHSDSLSIQLGRYPDAMVDRLERWERGARRRYRAFGPHDPSLHACDLDPEMQQQKEYLKSLRSNSQNLRCWNGGRYQRPKDGSEAIGQWGVNVHAEADTARNFEWNDASGESEEGLVYFSLVPERERNLIGSASASVDDLDQGTAQDALWRYEFLPQGQDSKGRKQSAASCDSGYMSSQSPDREAGDAAPLTAAAATINTRHSGGGGGGGVGHSSRGLSASDGERDGSPTSYLDAKRSTLSPSGPTAPAGRDAPSLLRRASSSLMRTISKSTARSEGVAARAAPGAADAEPARARQGATTPPSSNGYVPPDAHTGHHVGQVLDADREVLVKILVGRTGNKHAKLPDFAAVGWVWLIPSFEDPVSSRKGGKPKVGSRTVVRFGKDEIDFRKDPVGVVGVEIEWEWIEVGEDDDVDEDEEGETVEVVQTEGETRQPETLRSLFDREQRQRQ
ncbi:uncharacterized protein PFL1_01151 [Pseudozyma flocculosa PF-1]|uniref:phosphatidylinositol-3,4,5-trisphosphate 3-phosphatase n=1 Tax=Pseudozyma flocculosa TaxID=84751 RepID=A0A5C3EWG9_9BASI|nr:uncharacterized protein PFL1_01151 [Pseudozyma flocculosa PF-1]EPQ30962.1 hypothetical protein PFL1_01151 [Pseudozyma flocculosa PF-1]SPO35797.1 related to Phosphatidylinositol-3,4,5-trisphosphate 3-phosphatase PTEN [Pseudozyma flocculosa]